MWVVKKIFILVFFCFIHAAMTEDVTVILQNGLNGYTGCFDSYVCRDNADSSSFTKNFANDTNIVTADCPT